MQQLEHQREREREREIVWCCMCVVTVVLALYRMRHVCRVHLLVQTCRLVVIQQPGTPTHDNNFMSANIVSGQGLGVGGVEGFC